MFEQMLAHISFPSVSYWCAVFVFLAATATASNAHKRAHTAGVMWWIVSAPPIMKSLRSLTREAAV